MPNTRKPTDELIADMLALKGAAFIAFYVTDDSPPMYSAELGFGEKGETETHKCTSPRIAVVELYAEVMPR